MHQDLLGRLAPHLAPRLLAAIRTDEPLRRHTTLRVGGPADLYFRTEAADDLAAVAAAAQRARVPTFLLGGGSNVCVSDRGVRGLVLHNCCRACEVGPLTRVDCGHAFMALFLKTARASLSGLEFAVGIPGSVGGALVSNAGAYRQNIDALVRSVDVVECGERRTVAPEWMGFAYRDSRLRDPEAPPAALIAVTLELTPAPRREILARARDNQRQRIFKQPWLPSAGSFFKNVSDPALAERIPDLPAPMRKSGVVPAGYLSMACGCRGLAVGGAYVTHRHGNIVVNRREASASDIRRLTETVKARVRDCYGVELQEEVMFVGDWDDWMRDEGRGMRAEG